MICSLLVLLDQFHKSESDLPSRAKGIGESPTIGIPIALSRAIEVATGLKIRETPISPEYLLSSPGKK